MISRNGAVHLNIYTLTVQGPKDKCCVNTTGCDECAHVRAPLVSATLLYLLGSACRACPE